MRKLIVFDFVTMDGFFEGANHSIEWHNVDEEFNEFAVEQLNNTDLLLFGRVTYDLMAGYWTSVSAETDDPVVANKMNTLPKIVFSRTMQRAEWENTRLIHTEIKEEISKIKNQPGKDIFVFGSADLVSSLMELDLIDEFRMMINPVVIGQGKPLFVNIKKNMNFNLIKTRVFNSGNVLLYYVPKKN